MKTLQIFVVLVTFYASEAKIPPGIHGPWKEYTAGMFPDIPFPHVPYTDDYPPAQFDSCSGKISQATVITTPGYPFATVKKSCKWTVQTRRCFLPRFTVMSTIPSSPATDVKMEVVTDKAYSFAEAAAGTVFDGTTQYAEVTYESQIESDAAGYGFQLSVDFIPQMTQECLAGFQYLSDMTCVPTEVQGDSFVVRTPGHPSKQVPAGFGCKHSVHVTGNLKNYDVTFTSSVKGGERLMLKDLFQDKIITSSTPSVTISTTKPFFLMYLGDSAQPSSGFTAQVKPAAIQAPEPCNTLITVVTNNTRVTNPYATAILADCAITFKTDSSAKKLVFLFDEYTISSKEFSKLYTNYRLGEVYSLSTKRAPITAAQEAVFVYRPGTTISKWVLKVALV